MNSILSSSSEIESLQELMPQLKEKIHSADLEVSDIIGEIQSFIDFVMSVHKRVDGDFRLAAKIRTDNYEIELQAISTSLKKVQWSLESLTKLRAKIALNSIQLDKLETAIRTSEEVIAKLKKQARIIRFSKTNIIGINTALAEFSTDFTKDIELFMETLQAEKEVNDEVEELQEVLLAADSTSGEAMADAESLNSRISSELTTAWDRVEIRINEFLRLIPAIELILNNSTDNLQETDNETLSSPEIPSKELIIDQYKKLLNGSTSDLIAYLEDAQEAIIADPTILAEIYEITKSRLDSLDPIIIDKLISLGVIDNSPFNVQKISENYFKYNFRFNKSTYNNIFHYLFVNSKAFKSYYFASRGDSQYTDLIEDVLQIAVSLPSLIDEMRERLTLPLTSLIRQLRKFRTEILNLSKYNLISKEVINLIFNCFIKVGGYTYLELKTVVELLKNEHADFNLVQSFLLKPFLDQPDKFRDALRSFIIADVPYLNFMQLYELLLIVPDSESIILRLGSLSAELEIRDEMLNTAFLENYQFKCIKNSRGININLGEIRKAFFRITLLREKARLQKS